MNDIQILSDKIQIHFKHPIYCVLYGKNIHTVGQMIQLKDSELKSIRNFGPVAMKKVIDVRNLVVTVNTTLNLQP